MNTVMDEYILFADETKKTPSNPYFCFAGFVIKRTDYENILIPKINQLKEKHLETTDIILHYTDIKNNKGPFSVFQNSTKRNHFWQDFVSIIKSVDIHILGVYFDQNIMNEVYGKGATTYYDIAYRHLLENYMHFLKSKNGIGSVCIESRTFKENMFLERNHFDYTSTGSIYFSSKDTSTHMATIEFVIKGDNCIGLQVADVIPARLMRIVNRQTDNHLLNKTIYDKLYWHGTDKEKILGLKNIL